MSGARHRVLLVVDDSEVDLRLIGGLLRRNPQYRMELVANGKQALEQGAMRQTLDHLLGRFLGRRADGADGHGWGGGLGALLDVDGNDTYRAGNFSQGLGYWYGTGLLWDGGGDDAYESVYFTQGSGAHFAIGALIALVGQELHRRARFRPLSRRVHEGEVVHQGSGEDARDGQSPTVG